MARIENWDRIKRTVIVLKHDPYSIDKRLLERIAIVEREKLKLIRECGRCLDVYVPDRHPLIERNMLWVGRVIELGDVKRILAVGDNGERKKVLNEKKALFLIDTITEINDLTNILSDETLINIDYDEEKYHKVSGIIYDEKEILRIPGVQEKNLI